MNSSFTRSHSLMFRLIMVIVIIIAIGSAAYQVFVFFQTNAIIKEHNCVATDRVTQEFESNGNSMSSITKVYYQCDDRNRWLRSYDLF